MALKLWSSDFSDEGKLPLAQAYNGWGHAGQNLSPHLAWSGAPAGTKSFVLTMFDPHPAMVSGWWHWLVFDIPAGATSLTQGAGSGNAALPAGAQHGRNDFGEWAYGGPAPDAGATNRYVFTLYALGVERLDLDGSASAAMIAWVANANTLDKASLFGLYA